MKLTRSQTRGFLKSIQKLLWQYAPDVHLENGGAWMKLADQPYDDLPGDYNSSLSNTYSVGPHDKKGHAWKQQFWASVPSSDL